MLCCECQEYRYMAWLYLYSSTTVPQRILLIVKLRLDRCGWLSENYNSLLYSHLLYDCIMLLIHSTGLPVIWWCRIVILQYRLLCNVSYVRQACPSMVLYRKLLKASHACNTSTRLHRTCKHPCVHALQHIQDTSVLTRFTEFTRTIFTSLIIT